MIKKTTKEPNERKTKIGIDARFYGPSGKGLGRYVQKLIEHLEILDGNSPSREYLVLLKKENYDEYQPQKKNFKKIVADYPWYSFSEQVSFPFFLDSLELDLMHFTHFNVPLLYRSKFLVTIHDLILFHYPTVRNTAFKKHLYYFKLLAYRKVINSAATRADKVIAVSEFTRDDIISNLGVSGDKVITTLEGCEPASPEATGEKIEPILEKYGIIKPYLLYVGNAYPHKNLEGLCIAFGQLRKQHPELQLVLVGGRDFFYTRIEKFITQHRINGVVFTGFVFERELDGIYRGALLYVFPSFYEGFGLPPLEALARGLPVVSSSRTSMPEVLGEAVLYFDPDDTRSMVETIERAISSQKLRDEILKKGQARLSKFRWEDMARKTLDAYKALTR